MAKKKKSTSKPKKEREEIVEIGSLQDEWQYADQALSDVRDIWEEHEKIFFNREKGQLSEEAAKSNVNDGHLSTAIIQRTQRILAQEPTGRTQALDSTDQGKAHLMDAILRKYIIPNANAQYDHLTKLKLWVIYSQIYGSMPLLVDYVVKDDYVGPDCWIIPIRQYYPQPGVKQPQDMDYCFVDSFVTVEWLKGRNRDYWQNIDDLLEKIDEEDGKKRSEYEYQSYAEKEWGSSDHGGTGRFAQVLIRTKYERDRWVTYAPDYQDVGPLRDIDNPHQNGRLPIVVKETIPLLDRSVGLGDIERGKPVQKAINSLTNLYMDAIKYSIFPPMIINRQGVVPSSIQWKPMAKWFETIPNSIRQLQLSPAGINSFNNAAGHLIANLNNMLGTSDLSVQKDVDPSMGKTPQAVKYQVAKESAADMWERQSLEAALEDLYDRYIDLMAIRQEKPIELSLFEGEIEEIASLYPDVVEMFEDGTGGKLTIKPEAIEGRYRFFIDSGSTIAKDEAMQNQALTGILQVVMGNPAVIQAIREKGKDLDMGELLKHWLLTSGVVGADKMITDYQLPVNQPAPNQAPGGPQIPPGGPEGAQMGSTPGGGVGQQFQDPQIRQVAEQLFGNG